MTDPRLVRMDAELLGRLTDGRERAIDEIAAAYSEGITEEEAFNTAPGAAGRLLRKLRAAFTQEDS